MLCVFLQPNNTHSGGGHPNRRAVPSDSPEPGCLPARHTLSRSCAGVANPFTGLPLAISGAPTATANPGPPPSDFPAPFASSSPPGASYPLPSACAISAHSCSPPGAAGGSPVAPRNPLVATSSPPAGPLSATAVPRDCYGGAATGTAASCGSPCISAPGSSSCVAASCAVAHTARSCGVTRPGLPAGGGNPHGGGTCCPPAGAAACVLATAAAKPCTCEPSLPALTSKCPC
jgi:hypothetical protein